MENGPFYLVYTSPQATYHAQAQDPYPPTRTEKRLCSSASGKPRQLGSFILKDFAQQLVRLLGSKLFVKQCLLKH